MHQLATFNVLGFGQGVLVLQVGGADAVQQHIHLGDGPDRAVEFLPEQVGLAAVFAVLVDKFLGCYQHAAGATAGVVNIMLELWLDEPHHHPHHRARPIELAAFLARRIGKFANQVFVGRTQQVGELEVFIAQAMQAEMGDELLQLDIGNLALADFAGEVDVFENVVKADVVAFNPNECFAQQAADIGLTRVVDQVAIARFFRHPEIAVLFVPTLILCRDFSICLRLAGLDLELDHFFTPLFEDIGTALEEQHPEDVFFEFGGIHLAA